MSRRSTRVAAITAEGLGLPVAPTHVMPSISTTTQNTGSYFHTHYNHPANNRLFLGPNLSSMGGKGHGASSAVPKAPKAPEKPLMPYMRYSRKVWDEVKANNPDLKLWEIGKIIGQMWRELPTVDKQQFMEEYEVEKIQHMDLMKSYHNSSAYQSYLHAKSRAEALEASADTLGTEKDDAYMSIEPVDDTIDDIDAGFSVKHVAAARFQRNHRLINDILGESIHVVNVRGVVTTHRLNVLKNQVQSLQQHQKKLETELQHIEDMHVVKKRKWKEESKEFAAGMKRLCGMSPQDYYKEWKQKQQEQAALVQQQKQQQAAAAAEAQANAEAKEQENASSSEPVAESVEAAVDAPEGEEEKTEEASKDAADGEEDKEEKVVETMETKDSSDTPSPKFASEPEEEGKDSMPCETKQDEAQELNVKNEEGEEKVMEKEETEASQKPEKSAATEAVDDAMEE